MDIKPGDRVKVFLEARVTQVRAGERRVVASVTSSDTRIEYYEIDAPLERFAPADPCDCGDDHDPNLCPFREVRFV